jgi:hypothetical protein
MYRARCSFLARNVPEPHCDARRPPGTTGARTRWAAIALGALVGPIALLASSDATARARADFRLLNALHAPEVLAVRAASPTGDGPDNAIDGREETVWSGRAGETQWRWSSVFALPTHIGLIRAHFGRSATSGVPTAYRWEVLPAQGNGCIPSAADDDREWIVLDGVDQTAALGIDMLAQPTRRSWFVDADACGLRLVVDRTNAGLPVVREVQAIETARDVLEGGRASDDGAYDGFRADGVVDGTYAGRWVGAPGRSRWTLRVELAQPTRIDRVRLVLGFGSTGVPREGGGRSYAMTWAPIHYTLEASEDGRHFQAIATEPARPDGTPLPVRRRLVTLAEPRLAMALRLVMRGATGGTGLPEPGAVPVVRELAAYRAGDERPILGAPWILSVNANPSKQSRLGPGGEAANDAYYARFLQTRMQGFVPSLGTADAQWLESIEGDDPELDTELLAESSPPPIVVLSGSNDWDYGLETGPDQRDPARWHWDPLRSARARGMGQLADAVKGRLAPFIGFCGGAQILALLEARRSSSVDSSEDLETIDRVLQRTSGHPVRGFAPPVDVDRAWPNDPVFRRVEVRFAPDDPLFADMAGPLRRATSHALPEWHTDAVRPDAFLPGGPLARLQIVATSSFCAPDVLADSPRDGAFPDPRGEGWCRTIPEAFRSRDAGWPVLGAQFHAEQHDFVRPAPGDPRESIADPLLFLAAAYEQVVDAYERVGP